MAFMLALLGAVGAGATAAQVRTQLVAAPVLREEIGPATGEASDICPTTSRLLIQTGANTTALEINPCSY